MRDIGSGRLRMSGLYVRTDRTETEHSLEYNDPDQQQSRQPAVGQRPGRRHRPGQLALAAELRVRHGRRPHRPRLRLCRFQGRHASTPRNEIEYDDEDTPPAFDESEGTRILTDTDDSELTFSSSRTSATCRQRRNSSSASTTPTRIATWTCARARSRPTRKATPLPPYAEFDRARSTIEERRVDPYLMFSGNGGALRLGSRPALRDHRRRRQRRRRADDSNDYADAAAVRAPRWDVTDNDRISFSVARTVRRPNFNSPAADAGRGVRRQRLRRQPGARPGNRLGHRPRLRAPPRPPRHRRRQRLLPRRQGPDRGRQHRRAQRDRARTISRTRSRTSSTRIPARRRPRRAIRCSIRTASSTPRATSATATSTASSSMCRRR